MLPQRLARWISRLVTPLAVHLHLRVPAPQQPHAREMTLSGVAAAPAAPTSRAGQSVSTRWLADAQRLRPRRLPTGAPPRGAVPESGASFPEHLERRSPVPGRARPSVPTAKPPATPATQQQPAASPAAHPPHAQPSHPEQQGAAADSTRTPPAAGEPLVDERLRRQLYSLRFLVRHGVYNEGFAANRVPEQYRASLGLNDEAE